MAKTQKKKSKKRGSSSPSLTYQLKQILTAVGILILAVVVSAVVMRHFIGKKTSAVPEKHRTSSPVSTTVRDKSVSPPAFEIYPREDSVSHIPVPDKKVPELKPVPPSNLPTVAIIVDDIGYDKAMAEKFLNLDIPLTISILPFSPFQKSIVHSAQSKGAEMMLHLPMEPSEYPRINPGPGALLSSMTPDELINQLLEDIHSLNSIKGVNNHMGSKLTTISTQMYQIFTILKKQNLYFIDSRTTPVSLCKPSARLLRIPFAQRDVFLDHKQEADFIRGQIKHLIHLARKNGTAIAIAHPYPLTYKILRESLPELKKQVNIVPASHLTHIIG